MYPMNDFSAERIAFIKLAVQAPVGEATAYDRANLSSQRFERNYIDEAESDLLSVQDRTPG
jgi:hypothetical protein